MAKAIICAIILAATALLVIGCGGSAQAPPDQLAGGDIVGTLAAASQPEGYRIYLDGQELTRRPSPDGSFRVPGIEPGEHLLSLTAPDGMQGVHAAVTVIEGRASDTGDLLPRPGGRITGTVVKRLESGILAPVPRAEIVATSVNVWPAIDLRAAPPEGPVIIAFTDEDGVYDMRAVPPGGYVVSVSVPGYQARVKYVRVRPWTTSVADFILVPVPPDGVGTVKGLVHGVRNGSSAPLEGARVTIIPQVPWEPIILAGELNDVASAIGVMPEIWPPPIRRYFSTLTDWEGAYSLNVPAGPALMTVFAEGFHPQRRQITVPLHDTTIQRFRLQQRTGPPPPLPLAP